MSNTRNELKRAYKLIKRDRTDEAEQIIRPILAAEPDNAEAWWLLAHTADDPMEVRGALNKMLELDPRNSNASKAHELLAMVNQQYPDQAASSFDDEATFSPFTTSEPEIRETADLFGGDDFAEFDQEMFPDLEEPAALGDQSKREPEGIAFDIPEKQAEKETQNDDIEKLFDFPPEMSDEAKAAVEEKVGRRGGRGRFLRTALLLLIPLLIVVALVVLTSGGKKSEKKDPGQLAAVQVDSSTVKDALTAAENDLTTANLGGERRTLVAQSALGSTLFVEFCSQPDLTMPDMISQAMTIAARQASAVQNDLAAVGISVNLCNSISHDTLYRAAAPVNDAVRFLNGDFGTGSNGLAKFQATWKIS